VLIRRVDEPGQHPDRLLEFLVELLLLLVTPGLSQLDKPSMEGGQLSLKLGIKPFQVVREAAEFFGIDDRSGHAGTSISLQW